MTENSKIYALEHWFNSGNGPRYQQLHRHIANAISSGKLLQGSRLPAERDMAELAGISRVTVRKAVAKLVADGLIEPRHGAGSFVRNTTQKLKQSLSTLVSFTENMSARGVVPTSEVLSAGLFAPSPQEMIALGLSANDQVARVQRLRFAGNVPMALETSSLPQDILPYPERVKVSLYSILRQTRQAPTRAIQRVTAVNISGQEASHLKLPDGTAVLKIDRTGYLATRRPIEYTTGFYRSDIYDFISELGVE
ncbi:GntR family transcriptional regulator [Falsihalocynthiibacter arcticus]|uniref:Phage tail protein n=1 Tax=Falsihalocynthiibacter arcticus TaxID=1579316 RepID=A0A126V4V0_9RHOB|nr:GntR family transcriptional regulator [Falsihalocynthiibacter arcticus]AML53293.1 phage tail protein [Falsihalocynthiibacter arcticus]